MRKKICTVSLLGVSKPERVYVLIHLLRQGGRRRRAGQTGRKEAEILQQHERGAVMNQETYAQAFEVWHKNDPVLRGDKYYDVLGFMQDADREIKRLEAERENPQSLTVEEAFEFDVIDNKTGEYPDLEHIVLNEKWAEGLMYCDMDGFAITEDGALILMDDCGKSAYCPDGRFRVVPRTKPERSGK